MLLLRRLLLLIRCLMIAAGCTFPSGAKKSSSTFRNELSGMNEFIHDFAAYFSVKLQWLRLSYRGSDDLVYGFKESGGENVRKKDGGSVELAFIQILSV